MFRAGEGARPDKIVIGNYTYETGTGRTVRCTPGVSAHGDVRGARPWGPAAPTSISKEYWLLALLVLRHDRNVARDELAAEFWPDSAEGQARFYLRKSLLNLRNALGPEAARLESPRRVRCAWT